MAKTSRKRITPNIETNVLTLSRRRCCICFCLESDASVKTDGQIAHVDHNPANNVPDNLAYLCLRHHDLYDTIRSQSKGLTVAEVKLYREELYRNLGTNSRSRGADSLVKEEQVYLCQTIRRDCVALGVEKSELITFIVQEAVHHSLLFYCTFSSLPLVFREYVLLLSWDFDKVRAERLLNRQEAYPLNDTWNSCLALYRQTTLLPYRTKGRGQLLTRTEARRSIAAYKRLLPKVDDFLQLLRQNKQTPITTFSDIEALVDNAEFALANDDISTTVAHLEAVLSTIHKLLLNYAPQGPLNAEQYPKDASVIEVPNDSRQSILLVDDCEGTISITQEILELGGYAITSATSANAALRAMVEHEFDMVITDLVMPGADGREVVIAAKKTSDKTKVIVLTGFSEMSRIADVASAGADGVMRKPVTAVSFLKIIKNLLSR